MMRIKTSQVAAELLEIVMKDELEGSKNGIYFIADGAIWIDEIRSAFANAGEFINMIWLIVRAWLLVYNGRNR